MLECFSILIDVRQYKGSHFCPNAPSMCHPGTRPNFPTDKYPDNNWGCILINGQENTKSCSTDGAKCSSAQSSIVWNIWNGHFCVSLSLRGIIRAAAAQVGPVLQYWTTTTAHRRFSARNKVYVHEHEPLLQWVCGRWILAGGWKVRHLLAIFFIFEAQK